MSNCVGGSTRAPQHTYILPRGATQVVSVLCSFKLNISQTFRLCLYMDIRVRIRTRTYTTWSGVSLLIISQTRTQVGHNRTRSICEVFHEVGSVTKFDKFQHEKI